MSSQATRRRPISALLLLLGLGIGCGTPEPPQGPWRAIDLWALHREAEGQSPVTQLVTQGAFKKVENPEAKRRSATPVKHIRAIRQEAGDVHSFELDLGTVADLSFIPLGTGSECIECAYVVDATVDEEPPRELFRHRVEPWGNPSAPTMHVSLTEMAHRTMTLSLRLEGTSGAALWGSPLVVTRDDMPIEVVEPERPNVIVIGVDTLRADALGPFRQSPSITPAFDRLAAESDLWLDAYSTFNITNPSFISIMTGLYGKKHGVYDNSTQVAEAHRTLAEEFRAAGYETAAVVAAPHLGLYSGLEQGFDHFVARQKYMAGELVVNIAMRWLSEPHGRFMLWLHFFDPHTPHTPPEPFARGYRPTGLSGLAPPPGWTAYREPGPVEYSEPYLGGDPLLYDAEVSYLDRQLDRLLDFLRSRGMLETTIIALVADHGENLGEHGLMCRHDGLFETTTHVPLLIRWPGGERRGRRIHGLVQTIDLYPTLLASCGITPLTQDGLDLRAMEPGGQALRSYIYSEHAGGHGLSVRTTDHRLSVNRKTGARMLYDLTTDPGESQDVLAEHMDVARKLSELLGMERKGARWFEVQAKPRPVELSPEQQAELEALGYAE